jgi:hypothetical protein
MESEPKVEPAGEAARAESKPAWLPRGAKHGADIPANSTGILLSEPGDGKTDCIRQLCFDPWLQSEGILILVSDGNALGTIGNDALARDGVYVQETGTFVEVRAVALEIEKARLAGERVPGTIAYDGLFGSSHKTRQFFDGNPIMTEKKDRSGNLTGEMVQNTQREFRDKGYGGVDAIVDLRDRAHPRTLIATATIWTSNWNPIPELAVEGNIIPKNLTGLSTFAFYIKREEMTFDPLVNAPTPEEESRPWLKFDRDSNGKLTGKCVRRFFLTEGGGEVKTKPHRVANFRENKDLPNMIRRVHGKEVINWWQTK